MGTGILDRIILPTQVKNGNSLSTRLHKLAQLQVLKLGSSPNLYKLSHGDLFPSLVPVFFTTPSGVRRSTRIQYRQGPAASIRASHAQRGSGDRQGLVALPATSGREHLSRCAQLKSGPLRTEKTPQPIPPPMGSVRVPAVTCACASQTYPTNIRLYNSSIHWCLFSGISPEARDSTSTC